MEQARASRLDGLPDAMHLVRRKIVHDDDVAPGQRWDQHLLDVGDEHLAVDRAAEHTRSGQPIRAEARDERGRVPVPVWRGVDKAMTRAAAAVKPDHVGFRPGLVDEYQPAGMETRLFLAPLRACPRDVGPILFGRAE